MILFEKGLWLKEWRAIRWLLAVVFIIFLIGIFIGMFRDTSNWQGLHDYYNSSDFVKEEMQSGDVKTDAEVKNALTIAYIHPIYKTFMPKEYRNVDLYVLSFTGNIFFTITKFAVLALGLYLIVAERYTRSNRFTAALPYKRSHVMTVKLTLGIGVLTIAYFFSIGLGLLYMNTHIPPEFIAWKMPELLEEIVAGWLAYLLIFLSAVTVSLCIASPFISVLIAIAVPFVPRIIALTIDNLYAMVHLVTSLSFTKMASVIRAEQYVDIFSPLRLQQVSGDIISIHLVLVVLFIMLNIILFKYQALERNGHLFAFKWVKWPLYVGFSLCSGAVISNLAYTNNTGSNMSPWLYVSIGALITIAVFTALVLIVNRVQALFQMSKLS